MGIGTFGYFTQARLAIYAAHTGLGVTGNNISNVNTDGYTRQRLDQTSFYRAGVDRYYSANETRVGLGVRCDSLSQIRDPYLDIRYRSEASVTGQLDTKVGGLESIQNILDEVGDGELPEGDDFGVLAAYLSEIRDALSKLVGSTGHTEFDTQVRSNAKALVDQFHTYSANLTELYQNTEERFKQKVDDVNKLLSGIQQLNENIRLNDIYGDDSLELRDERNRQIDQLAELMKIKVTYTTEDIGAGREIEKLVISLDNANPNPNITSDESKLIDGIFAGQVSIRYAQALDAGGNQKVDATTGKPLYLDADGNETTDVSKAALDPYFRMDLSELRDVRGNLFHDIVGSAKIYLTQQEFAQQKQAYDALGGPQPDANGVLQFSTFIKTRDGLYYRQNYTKTPSEKVELDDNDLAGGIQAWRELLTERGEFSSADEIAMDPNAASKRGIIYYQNVLDLLARQFADTMNGANQGFLVNGNGEFISATGTSGETIPGIPYTDAAGNAATYALNQNDTWAKISGDAQKSAAVQAALKFTPPIANPATPEDIAKNEAAYKEALNTYLGQNGAKKVGVNLFSNHGTTDEGSNITAANISISKTWQTTISVVPSFVCPTGFSEPATTDSSNIIHLQNLFETQMDYTPKTIVPDAASDDRMFFGTYEEMWTNISTVLGNDTKISTGQLNTSYQNLTSIDSDRANVSSVDFNEEAMNLMQYAKSYNAACRLMTTLDSVLDKLVNGTGVTT